jgi:hypothetical protein
MAKKRIKIRISDRILNGASGQSRTDDRRFTKSRLDFVDFVGYLASQFQSEFTWLGYQSPGQLRGNIRGKSGKFNAFRIFAA